MKTSKGEIPDDEQFHLLPQCFQLYLTIKLSFMTIFQVFFPMFSKSSAGIVVCGKGLKQISGKQLNQFKANVKISESVGQSKYRYIIDVS